MCLGLRMVCPSAMDSGESVLLSAGRPFSLCRTLVRYSASANKAFSSSLPCNLGTLSG